MANKKAEERGIRKLTKLGRRSIGLTLPIEMVRELKWKERQKVVVKRIKGGMVIGDYRKK